MTHIKHNNKVYPTHLQGKDDFKEAMERIYAWYEGQIIDRVPVRFSAHNALFENSSETHYTDEQWKQRWFDTEAVIDGYIRSIESRQFLAETFPVYWPNLGPDVYAAFYGCDLKYSEITSWSRPCINERKDISILKFGMEKEYFKKLDELTKCALEKGQGRFLVGYTDLHPGVDCVLAWCGMENLCTLILDDPEFVKELIGIASRDFEVIFNHFDDMLKSANMPSVTWMEIPSFGKIHIPSCDFATTLSSKHFEEFCLPVLQHEVKMMTHNIFHLDGSGLARHLDIILEVPEITAIQWVQGVGNDVPILQWMPLIRKIQTAGKSVVVDLKKEEVEDFIDQAKPEGLLLCIAEDDEEEQKSILKRIAKW